MVQPSISAQSKGNLSTRQKLVLQPLDQQQWQPTTQNYYPAITTITSEKRPDGTDRVFVETFLMDAIGPINKKGWKPSYENPDDYDSRVQASKNHPLVLFQTPHPTKDGEMIFDHPVAPITSLEAAADPVRATIEFQKKYTIGYARHFKKVKDGVWNAIYEITNPKAKRFFLKAKEKGIKLFTSPHIVRPSSEPDRKNIREWAIIHNAIVSSPAWSETIASVKDVKAVTQRTPVDFSSLFASMDTPDSDEYELDAEILLENYEQELTSHDNKSENVINMPESASQVATTAATPSQQQGSTVTTFDTTTGNVANQATIPHSQPIQELQNAPPQEQKTPEQQQQEQENKQQQQQTSELDTLKAQVEALNKQNQDLQQKYAQNERKAQIEKLFAPVVAQLFADPKTGLLNEKEYNAEISRLLKSNHNYDEISELIQARYVLAQYNLTKSSPKSEKASFTSQESASASFPYTKMQTATTNNNNAESGVIANNSIGLSVLRKLQVGGLY